MFKTLIGLILGWLYVIFNAGGGTLTPQPPAQPPAPPVVAPPVLAPAPAPPPAPASGTINTKVRPNISDSFAKKISGKTYTIEPGRWNINSAGAVASAAANTDNFQRAIDWAMGQGYGKIIVPPGVYYVGKYGHDSYQAGLELHSNMIFQLSDGAQIHMAPNDKFNSCLISVTKKENVVIRGGELVGDRDGHDYKPTPDGKSHEEGHLICVVTQSKNVLIENMKLHKAAGDGMLLTAWGPAGSSVDNIIVRSNDISHNRRQGISVVGGTNILIEKNVIHDISGTAPMSGIDIEGVRGYRDENIVIADNTFYNNKAADIINFTGLNVWIERNQLRQGVKGQPYGDAPIVLWKMGDVSIRNNTITMMDPTVNNWNGIILYPERKKPGSPGKSFIQNNTCNNCGISILAGSNFTLSDNKLVDGFIVVMDSTNINVIGNAVTHKDKCWAYRFKGVTGSARGNSYNGAAFNIPLGRNVPYNGCWI